MLKNKNIIVGITGSIAAYKAALLVRLLIHAGAQVKVVMTPLAKEFITPLTLATLSRNPILVDFFNPENGDWNSHVDLGLWADAYVIAPATANTMAKMAGGIADNLLLTTYLSARCPVFIAPAMDLDMYRHASTQHNVTVLQSYGNHIIEPSSGELASGLEGKGRMAEPEMIVNELTDYFAGQSSQPLANKKILVTAGPTYERIDPVRFIGNFSSGKMGYALASVLADWGAHVTLVSGPVERTLQHPRVNIVHVESASDMFQACSEVWDQVDGAILVAAVADFAPETFSPGKIKKEKGQYTLPLKPTVDIAVRLGKEKGNRFLVGFALETENELSNAEKKIKEKNFDFIVLNSLQDHLAGFRHDTNKITIVDNNSDIVKFSVKEKQEVARDIVGFLCKKMAYA